MLRVVELSHRRCIIGGGDVGVVVFGEGTVGGTNFMGGGATRYAKGVVVIGDLGEEKGELGRGATREEEKDKPEETQ